MPSFVWKDTEAWPTGGKTASALEINLGGSGSSIALVIGDQNASAATANATNISTREFHLKLSGFGPNDLIYVDDLGRHEDATYALDRIFDTQRTDNPDEVSADFGFDQASPLAGGLLTIVDQSFGDLPAWITLLGGAEAMPLGTPILFA